MGRTSYENLMWRLLFDKLPSRIQLRKGKAEEMGYMSFVEHLRAQTTYLSSASLLGLCGIVGMRCLTIGDLVIEESFLRNFGALEMRNKMIFEKFAVHPFDYLFASSLRQFTCSSGCSCGKGRHGRRSKRRWCVFRQRLPGWSGNAHLARTQAAQDRCDPKWFLFPAVLVLGFSSYVLALLLVCFVSVSW